MSTRTRDERLIVIWNIVIVTASLLLMGLLLVLIGLLVANDAGIWSIAVVPIVALVAGGMWVEWQHFRWRISFNDYLTGTSTGRTLTTPLVGFFAIVLVTVPFPEVVEWITSNDEILKIALMPLVSAAAAVGVFVNDSMRLLSMPKRELPRRLFHRVS